MRKILFVICVLFFSAFTFAQQDTSLTNILNKTTLSATDIVPFQITSGGNWYWRKITGANFWTQARDTTQAQLTTLLNASNSWNGINNFDGATFNAGSHGGVSVLDSLDWVTAYGQFLFPPSLGALSWIGSGAVPYDAIYSQSFVIINSGGSDSMTVVYEDGVTTFEGVVEADTIKGLSTITFYGDGIIPSDVNDSTITIEYTNSLQFLLPGADMDNLEEIIMSDMPTGDVAHSLYIWINESQDYNITFQDIDGTNSSDGNLQLNGDFDMDAGDMLHIQWLGNYDGGLWIEVSRSDNR